MEENFKVAHVKNMNRFNFNLTINISIDSNVTIKKVLDINSYLFDQKTETGNGKAIVTGKVGIKVLYLDTDNMTNTLTEVLPFSEVFSDPTITTETYINLTNPTIINEILSADSNLKINCEVSQTPIMYINLAMVNNLEISDSMITKKKQINSTSICKYVSTQFDHTSILETKDLINKTLCVNSFFCPENISSKNGYAVVEGELLTMVLYETTDDDFISIKEITETSKLKCDIEIEGLKENDLLDLYFCVDKSKEEISTELEENLSLITIKNSIKVNGAILRPISIDVVDDLYCTNHEVETTITKRECSKGFERLVLNETVLNETTLSNSETAIDEVIANLNQVVELTNSYIKDNKLFLEGVVSSNMSYIDENKEIKTKKLEMPFVVNTSVSTENLGCINPSFSILNSKIKVKRGTIIETEYTLFIVLNLYQKETCELVDSFKIGKQLDFSKYDYQIFVAKPNESSWDLCKRIKISPQDLIKLNKDLPLLMEGGEKIVVKR